MHGTESVRGLDFINYKQTIEERREEERSMCALLWEVVISLPKPDKIMKN